MSVSPVTASPGLAATSHGEQARLRQLPAAEQAKAVAGQFEAVLLRQFLEESVGNIMGGKEGGASGNVYGYLLTDTLANQLSSAGGLGLSRVLQAQLTPRTATAAAAPTSTTP